MQVELSYLNDTEQFISIQQWLSIILLEIFYTKKLSFSKKYRLLLSALGSSAQGRYGRVGASQEEDHKHDQRDGALLIWKG